MKEIITEQAFRTQLEKSPVGGFLFFGEEDYLKAYALKQAKSIVSPDPSLAIFNDINVDCSTGGVNGDAFFAAVAAAPMMADVKLVTLNGLSVNDMKAEELDRFIDSLELLDEYDFNLLIVSVPSGMIDEGRLPKAPSSALKKLGEKLTPVHFPRVPDAKLSSWIVRHFAHRGIAVREGIPAAILEYCGRNMYSLANEIDKLSFYALSKGRKEVLREDIELVACPSDEISAFALSSAITDGNTDLALRILGIMKSKHVDPLIILGELSRAIGDLVAVKKMTDAGNSIDDMLPIMRPMTDFKIRAYQAKVRDMPLEKLEEALELCTEADLAQKQSMSGYIAIEKLICSL